MCVKQSQFYCVKLHEQPRRGVRLFASTEQPVYRLSPSLLRRGGFRREVEPLFRSRGDGGVFEK